MRETRIVDTSVLIALEKINLLALLCQIYETIIVTEGVIKEFGPLNLECCKTETVQSPYLSLLTRSLNLGRGESEVIALASATGLGVVIDDLKARKVAETMGLKVTGSVTKGNCSLTSRLRRGIGLRGKPPRYP